MKRALCYVQRGDEDLVVSAKAALQQLLDLGLIVERVNNVGHFSQQQGSQGRLTVTPLGKAVFKGRVMVEVN